MTSFVGLVLSTAACFLWKQETKCFPLNDDGWFGWDWGVVGFENEFRNAIYNLVLVQCLACSFEKLCVPGSWCECTCRAQNNGFLRWHKMSISARGRETSNTVKQCSARECLFQMSLANRACGVDAKHFLACSSRLHSAVLIRKWNGAALINEQGSLQLEYRVKTLSFWKNWVKVQLKSEKNAKGHLGGFNAFIRQRVYDNKMQQSQTQTKTTQTYNQGRIHGDDRPPKTYECNFHHDFVQFGKRHSR